MKFRNVESSNGFRFSQFLLCHTWLVKKITKNVMKQLFFVASEVFLVTSLPQFQSCFFLSQDSENRQQLLLILSTDDTDLSYTDKVFSNVYEELHIFTKTMWHWGTDKGPDDLSQFLRTTLRLVFFQKVPALEGAAVMFVSKRLKSVWLAVNHAISLYQYMRRHTQWRDWRGGGQRGEPLPWQGKCWNWAPFNSHFDI